MLQQTQVATVLPYYKEWLRRFPNFDTLARAAENDVLHAWQGLGYYVRARNLHAAAKIISTKYGGRCPSTTDDLRSLPGVGRYTAHAIVGFAFDQSVPLVEANTTRVLARLFNLQTPIDRTAGREALWNHARTLIPKRSPCLYNSALIDLGALICLPRPKCAICPVKTFCRAVNPETLPIKKARPQTKRLIENHALVVRKGRILLQRAERRWRGMWILPPLQVRSATERPVHISIFPFTHHRITLKIFGPSTRKISQPAQRWFDIDSLDSIPIPSPHRRALWQLFIAAPGAQPRRRQS